MKKYAFMYITMSGNYMGYSNCKNPVKKALKLLNNPNTSVVYVKIYLHKNMKLIYKVK